MKKIFFGLILAAVLFFPISNQTQAYAAQSDVIKLQAQAEEKPVNSSVPITRWWYETPPVPYQGPRMFVTITQFGQCLDGYIFPTTNVGAAHFIYEGYLYPCGGTRPLPSIKPIEEESE